ncbi:MAG: ABC transporter permease [Acidobacteriaceae bacterium]|nr:ABC transporter permease [Acidobacteriaceae bacterium]MBV9501013.1 ABC transporter permease [Acidobacteriaceae bacterium]
MIEQAVATHPGRTEPDEQRFVERSLVQLTLSRFHLFFREPDAIFWIFVFPILLALGLGIAFRNRPPDVLKIGVVGPNLAKMLGNDKNLSVATTDQASGELALKTGRIELLAIAGPYGVTYRYDDTNPDARTARLLTDNALQHSAGRSDSFRTQNDLVRETGSRYIDFVVPGLLGMNLMGSSIWGLGLAIVDFRQKKLLKRLIASPMRRWEYLASFILSRLVMLPVEVIVFLAFAALVFGVPLRGSLWELAALCVVSSLCFSALGLLTACRARTIEAVSGLMNLVMLPMWILSGIFFSADRFPAVVQPVIRALPLTAVIDALRGNMLQGAGFTKLQWQLVVIAAWCLIPFFLALRLFRWR